MSQYLNWVSVMGLVLILSGFGLLGLALVGARKLEPARHRRRTGSQHGPVRVSTFRRGVASPGAAPTLTAALVGATPVGNATDIVEPAVPATAPLPRIGRSVLLADTIRLNQILPRQEPAASISALTRGSR